MRRAYTYALLAMPSAAGSAACSTLAAFLDLRDVYEPWGLLDATASALEPLPPSAAVKAPEAPFSSGSASVLNVVPAGDGAWHVFAEFSRVPNTTTHRDACGSGLARSRTKDLASYTDWEVVLCLPGLYYAKSLHRHADRTLAYFWNGNAPPETGSRSLGLQAWLSTDGGEHWDWVESGPWAYPLDKDTMGLIHDGAQWIDLQVVRRNHTRRFCDNVGCHDRRVVSVRTSADGVQWSQDHGYIVPEAGLDPPELQFYQMHPFHLPCSGRLFALTLLYAPSPTEALRIPGYGHGACMDVCDRPSQLCCHGPFLGTEWFAGPPSGQGGDLLGWRRSYRGAPASTAAVTRVPMPAAVGGDLVFLAGFGRGGALRLPAARVAGVHARANGEFSSGEITLPHAACRLAVTVDARWDRSSSAGYEGRAAYVFAELWDPNAEACLAGYERAAALPIYDHVGEAPLRWNSSMPSLAGVAFRVRLFFRQATVYSVGCAAE